MSSKQTVSPVVYTVWTVVTQGRFPGEAKLAMCSSFDEAVQHIDGVMCRAGVDAAEADQTRMQNVGETWCFDPQSKEGHWYEVRCEARAQPVDERSEGEKAGRDLDRRRQRVTCLLGSHQRYSAGDAEAIGAAIWDLLAVAEAEPSVDIDVVRHRAGIGNPSEDQVGGES